MHQLIHVFHQNKLAGVFDMDASERIGRFEWLPEFQNAFGRFTQAFETNEQRPYQTFDAGYHLPAIFMDYLPGSFSKLLLNEALRNSSRTVESLSTLAWLSLKGNRGMGAFRFEPAGYPELNTVETVDLDKMVRYASLIWQDKGSELSDRRLRELLRCGLFVRGASPKILVAVNDFTGEVLSGQSQIPDGFQGWILKLDGVADGSAEKLADEYTYFQKAGKCGINVATCRTLRDGHWKHLLVKRFDRKEGEKQAFVTLPTTESSWESVFSRFRCWRLPYPDMEEMYRRMLFSILTLNKEYGHSKICLTYTEQDQWRLAPAFNLIPRSEKESFTLSLNGKTNTWSVDELLHFGKQINVKKAKVIYEITREHLETTLV